MNAAIRAVSKKRLKPWNQMKGILKGYSGLLNEEIIEMTAVDVSDNYPEGRNYPVYCPLCRNAYRRRPEKSR